MLTRGWNYPSDGVQSDEPQRDAPQPLRHLFLVDVKPRLINNTPSDVYRAASRFPAEDVEVIDLRFQPRDAQLPASEAAYWFLETAGTWMCFDWDPERFRSRLDELVQHYPRLTVIGPQAMALKELTGHSYEIIDTVHFGQAIGANGEDHKASIAARWLDPSRHRRYNGQSFDGTALRLVPTFSVSYAMTCPLRCTFCYYADADPPLRPQFDFRATTADIWRAWEAGHRNFYFMDPNFLPSAEEFALLRQLYEGTGGDFAYYCQVSPNFLTESRLVRLAETGCRGMVVGIENRARIVAKGSVPEARRRVERVLAHGMMPTLFFMVDGGNDGGNDVEDVVAEFDGIPFRYTVLNNAFAGDRSLASIEAGFAEKRRLSARRRDLIVRLQARPDYLGSLAREGSVSRHTTSAH